MSVAGIVTVKFTTNFLNNLDALEQFLQDVESDQAFDDLIGHLSDTVVPNLENFPEMGRPFAHRPVGSVEAANATAALEQKLRAILGAGEIHEYLLTDYVILYILQNEMVSLLAIRHHRQLAFDMSKMRH